MNNKDRMPFDEGEDFHIPLPELGKHSEIPQSRAPRSRHQNGSEVGALADTSNRMIPVLSREQFKLRNAMLFTQEQQGIRSVLVTGAGEGVGVTSVATTLALGMSMDHKKNVLLVDANASRPRLHKLFSLSSSNDLTVAASAGFLDIAAVDGIPNLQILPCGDIRQGMAFDAKRFIAVLPALKEAFDFIIIDAPPVSLHFDALMLSLHLDSVIMVVEADRTRVEEVHETLRELKRAGANLLGIVLNRQRENLPAMWQNWL